MQYKINWERSNNVFILPEIIVKKYINLVEYDFIKVIVFIYSNLNTYFDEIEISNYLNISLQNTKDILKYWHNEGLLYLKDDKVEKTVSKKILKENLTLTKEEYSDYILNDSSVKFLIEKCEEIFGRTIKHAECNILVSINKLYGLSVDVVLMLVSYCFHEKKDNFSYIRKMAVTWSDEEIDTLEKAENYIMLLENKNSCENTIKNLFGINNRKLSKKESDFSYKWLNDWDINQDLIIEAYDRCVENLGKVSFPYINKVLKKWNELGYKDISQVIMDRKEEKLSLSHDIDEIQQYINNF